jgi:hypothetical protein
MVEKMDKVAADEFLDTARHTAKTLYKRYTNLAHQYEKEGE